MGNSSTTFSSAYHNILTMVKHSSVEEKNSRTKARIHVIPGGCSFKIDLDSGTLPVAGNRRYWPHIAAAETAWQFLGTTCPDFILEHAPKLWEKFVEDGELKAAYGYRWRENFGRDQIELALEALAADPTNRQIYISSWDPATDGLGQPNQPKNIPCPVGFTVNVVDNQVHMSVFIRSSDIFVGLPYDVMSYALTLDAIASSLNKAPGSLHITMAHAHLYQVHYDDLTKNLDLEDKFFPEKQEATEWLPPHECEPNLPGWSIEDIVANPRGYVDQVRRLADRVTKHAWDPRPILVE